MDLQNQKKLIQKIGIGVGILAVLVLVYYLFFKKDTVPVVQSTANVVSGSTMVDNNQASNTLIQLTQLKQAIDGESNVLGTPAFKSLINFSVDVSPEPYGGRENPFAETPAKIKRDAEAKKATTPSYEQTAAPVLSTTPPSGAN
ncbi:MAG: hypothetical protein PHS95_01950 [Candidatus Pacebacteria bacterium]|nr:hypothetical protein [Candidatus Paceibacterota bacterium]